MSRRAGAEHSVYDPWAVLAERGRCGRAHPRVGSRGAVVMWAIDLGTTNTGVARWDEAAGRPRLLELRNLCRRPGGEDHLEAPLLVPSMTQVIEQPDFWGRVGGWPPISRRFLIGKQALIGRAALDENPGMSRPSFAPSFKPYLGNAPLRTLARVGPKPISARDVARLFLRELMAEVKASTGERIRELVVTTPVDAYEAYRAELSAILKNLGVPAARFIDEPVAAAIGYGLGLQHERLALVVDFGGGTLDIALVALTARGVEKGTCEVIAKEGRPIGGNLVDRWFLEALAERSGLKLPEPEAQSDDSLGYRLLLQETCRVKESIFFNESEVFVPAALDELASFEQRIRGREETLTVRREDLLDVLKANRLFETLSECVDGVLAQAEKRGIRDKDIGDVLMVGGSTLLPGVYPQFEARFGRDVVRAWQPFEAVAFGACAFAAGCFSQSDFIVHDYAFVTHDLKTHQREYTVIVPRGTRFPTPPDLWKRQLVPTCSLGEPETMFKLVICEVGNQYEGDRRFAWDGKGTLHKLGGERGGKGEKLVVALNDANPTLGYLRPPHAPTDRRPRLEIAFGVNHDRWLCATVQDLKTKKFMMRDEPVVRLL